jgi:hypothetical protein
LELSVQLLGFLPPLGPAFTHIVHTILEAFGLGLQILVLALPTVPTPAQEPGLNSVRGCVPLRLTVILTCHVHRELLSDSVSVYLLKAKAQHNRRNQARPKPLKQLGLSSAQRTATDLAAQNTSEFSSWLLASPDSSSVPQGTTVRDIVFIEAWWLLQAERN